MRWVTRAKFLISLMVLYLALTTVVSAQLGSEELQTTSGLTTFNSTNSSDSPDVQPDTTPPASITNLQSKTSSFFINWTWDNPSDPDFSHVMVYVNGNWQLNTSNEFYNVSLAPGNFTLSTHTVDSSGNINYTWVNNTVDNQERWIVFDENKTELQQMGYTIIRELNDAVVVKNTARTDNLTTQEFNTSQIQTFNAIPDKKYTTIDFYSNEQINVSYAWSSGYTGKNITVAILDTGIDYNHQQLNDSYAGGYDFVNKDGDPLDDNGHGTHVAGIITANSGDVKGVAPNASIWMGKVCDAHGECYISDVAAGIEYVVKNNISRVISMSLGGSGTTKENCDYQFLAKKANWAVSKGVTVVAGAGNNPSFVAIPACASEVIAVGAVNQDNQKASFSGTGNALDIMAPGVGVLSTLPSGSGKMTGTSMATPHVSGAVALLFQLKPGLNTTEVAQALYTNAVDLGAEGWDDQYGWGLLDAKALFTEPETGPEPETEEHKGDFDGNCVIDFGDFMKFSSFSGTSAGEANYNELADFDDDGDVDFNDFMDFASIYGKKIC